MYSQEKIQQAIETILSELGKWQLSASTIQDYRFHYQELLSYISEANITEIKGETILNFLKIRIRTLTAGEKQMLAIAKAIYHHSNIISLDEPTASLTSKETEALFGVIRKLKADGITVLYVSHHLEEIFQICDRASIMRDGEYIQTLEIKEIGRAHV